MSKFFAWVDSIMDWITKRVWKSERSWFWVKQSWHFAGGVLIGMFGNLFKPYWITFVLFSFLAGVVIWKEIQEDRVTQGRFKTVVDCCSWILGFWIVSWAKFL